MSERDFHRVGRHIRFTRHMLDDWLAHQVKLRGRPERGQWLLALALAALGVGVLTGVFGSQLATTVSLIPSVPNGPDVSIVGVSSTIEGFAKVSLFAGFQIGMSPNLLTSPLRCD